MNQKERKQKKLALASVKPGTGAKLSTSLRYKRDRKAYLKSQYGARFYGDQHRFTATQCQLFEQDVAAQETMNPSFVRMVFYGRHF